MTIPAINFGRALQPGSPVHLAPRPSISCAFWCWKTKVGGSLSIVVGWPGAAKKYPKRYKALKHLLALLENCLMLVIPECATKCPLEVVCVFWNFLLREAIFSCPRVETTSRRQAGTGFQGINLLLPHTTTGFKDCDQGLTSLWTPCQQAISVLKQMANRQNNISSISNSW